VLNNQEKNRIRNKEKIREVMHSYMLKPIEQKAPWIVEIFSRQYRKGGNIYEGAKVIGASTDAKSGETIYSLTIGDSLVPSLKLSLIEYIVVL
jgi:hypothetical protein